MEETKNTGKWHTSIDEVFSEAGRTLPFVLEARFYDGQPYIGNPYTITGFEDEKWTGTRFDGTLAWFSTNPPALGAQYKLVSAPIKKRKKIREHEIDYAALLTNPSLCICPGCGVECNCGSVPTKESK